MLSVNFSADDLRPLVESVVAATLEAIENDEAKLGELLYNEVYAKLDPATFGVN